MALSLTGNIDRNTMLSGLVVSTTNLTERIAPQLVAGDKVSIDVFLTSSDGVLDIQQYAVQRLGLGVLNSKPTGGTYEIDYGGTSKSTLAFDASAQSFADAIEANAPSVPTPVTGTEIAPFTYIIQFGSNGTCSLPTINSSTLTPSSTVSVQRLITGDSSTKERWIVRLYENPLALIDGSWTNIEPVAGRKGIRGALNLGTQGIFDLLDGNASTSVTMELELTDTDGNLQTIFQSPCIVFSQVIGESISGVIPTPSGIPAEATTFLNSFPNPEIVGDLDIQGGLQVFGDVTFEESVDFEKGAEFKDDVTVTNGGIELTDTGLEVTGGGDVEVTGGGRLKVGALEVDSTDGSISDKLTIKADKTPDEDAKLELIDKSTDSTKQGGLYKKDGALYVGTYTDYAKNIKFRTQGTGQVLDFPADSGIRFLPNGDLLQHYSEGTFTAKLESGDETITQENYNVNQCNYVRIGDTVQVNILIEITNFLAAWKTSTKDWKITGLPFTAIGNHNIEIRPRVGWLDQGASNITGNLGSANSYLWVEKFVNNGTTAGAGINTSRINANSFPTHPFNFSTGAFSFIVTGSYKTGSDA